MVLKKNKQWEGANNVAVNDALTCHHPRPENIADALALAEYPSIPFIRSHASFNSSSVELASSKIFLSDM